MIEIISKLSELGVEKFVYGIIVFIVGLLVIKKMRGSLEKLFKKNMPTGMAKNSSNLSYYVLLFLLVLLSLQVAGFQVQSLMVAGGVIGVAIGFASQTTVSNLISGLFLYIDRPFDIGDSVDIGGTGGVVEEIKPLSTKLRTWGGPLVRIPNEKVFNANILNYKQVAARRFEHKFKITYSSNQTKAIEIITKILDSEPFVLKEPSASVNISSLSENGVELLIRAWTPNSKMYGAKRSVLKKILEKFKKNKITFASQRIEISK